nr:thymidylate synthase [Blastomonas sp. UPD001]
MAAEDHFEWQYLDLMRQVWTRGHERSDRTGVGTRSLFGATMRFDLSDEAIPLLTTKRVYWKAAAREMLWFLTGETNIRPLVEQGVHIWTDWPLDAYRKATGEAIDRDAFEARIIADAEFAERWGDLGPVYGKQWVDWPVYEPVGEGLFRKRERGINQIAPVRNSMTAGGSRSACRTAGTAWAITRLSVPRKRTCGRARAGIGCGSTSLRCPKASGQCCNSMASARLPISGSTASMSASTRAHSRASGSISPII